MIAQRNKGVAALAVLLAGLLLASCVSEGGIFDPNVYDPLDVDQGLTRDDYENMSAPIGDQEEVLSAKIEKGEVPMPQVAEILAAPKPPRIGKTKLVSLTVTDDVPLKDVLIELARLAEVDIEIGSGIRGGISFIAKDKPFNEVVARISDLAGLRYSIVNGVLRIERDLPYVKNYSVDFLNVTRNSNSDVSMSTDVLSISGGEEGGGGEGLTTGTSTSITTENESDFWGALETSLLEIINIVPAVDLEPVEGEEPLMMGMPGMGGMQGGTPGMGGMQGAAAGAGGGAGGGGAGASSGRGMNGSFFVVNRQAGILSVAATERQHERIREYIELLKRNVSAQVLIEAKILEVELDEEYQSGIDWSSSIGNFDFNVSVPSNIATGATFALSGGDNNLGINLDTLVRLTERFGTSRTLSSPRLHAINNQQAVLTFAENQIFFEVDIQRQDPQIGDGGIAIPGQTTFETTRRAVPIGIVLNILPSINLEDNEVTLNVRPTLTRQTSFVTDPGSALINAELPPDQQFTNNIPVIEVREMDSVMKLNSGSVMVIGGLMEEFSANEDEGVPGVSRIPWLGNAFKRTTKNTRKRELIIFLKATIVGTAGNFHNADKNVYKKFFDDPRPPSF